MKNSESLHSELLNEAKKRAEHIMFLKMSIIRNKIVVLIMILIYVVPFLLNYLLKVDLMVGAYCSTGIAILGILTLFYLLFANPKPSKKLIHNEYIDLVVERIKKIKDLKRMDDDLLILEELEKLFD